jgi:hypothetical protein
MVDMPDYKTEEIWAMGREIESHQGKGWYVASIKRKKLYTPLKIFQQTKFLNLPKRKLAIKTFKNNLVFNHFWAEADEGFDFAERGRGTFGKFLRNFLIAFLEAKVGTSRKSLIRNKREFIRNIAKWKKSKARHNRRRNQRISESIRIWWNGYKQYK